MIKDVLLQVSRSYTPYTPPPILSEIWATGFNNSGELGIGTAGATHRSSPVQVGTNTNWNTVYVYSSFSSAIDKSGSLWVWGDNLTGGLGLGDKISRSSPVQLGTETNWAKISYHIGLKTNGTLWAWGPNNNGQLGKNDTTFRSSPVQVGTDTNWKDVWTNKTTLSSMLGIKTDGTLWSWGSSAGFNRDNGTPAPVYEDLSYTLLRSYTMVAMGEWIGYAIKSGGTLWAWGINSDYNLGDGTTTVRSLPVQIGTDSDWSKITTAKTIYNALLTDVFREHNFGIKTGGSLWGWGANGTGELGLLDTTFTRSIPVQIGPDTNWSSVSAGTSFTVALKTNNTLWSWGNGGSGRLGINLATGNRSSPVQIGTRSDWTQVSSGASHTLAIRSDRTLWSWGLGTSRQLGVTTTTTGNRSSPTQVGVTSNWTQISAGGSHSMAVASNGTLWTWGANNNGQLGLRDTATRSSPVQVGTRSDWTQVSANGDFSLAIRSDKTLWVWGANGANTLGLGVTTNRSSPTQVGTLSNWVSGSFGAGHIAAITDTGILYTAGTMSQLGIGRLASDSISRSNPTQIGTDTNWDVFLEGDVLKKTNGTIWGIRNSPVQLGTETNWAKVSSWGNGNTTGVKTDGTLWNWSDDTTYTQIGTDTNYKDISGIYNSLIFIIKTDGTLWFKGANNWGQGGLGDTTNRTSPVQVGTLSTWVSASADSLTEFFIKQYT